MSEKPGSPVLRRALFEALSEVMLSTSCRAIADLVDPSYATVHRHGDDARQWRLLDGLDLGVAFPAFRRAIIDYLEGTGTAPEGSAAAAPRELIRLVGRHGSLVTLISEALEDNRIDADEARELLRSLDDDEQARAELKAHLMLIRDGGRR